MLIRTTAKATRTLASKSQAKSNTQQSDKKQRQGQSSTQGILSGLPQGQRPISTVAKDTKFDGKRRVTDPGHIQMQPSAEEQRKYGLPPAIGHSPQTSGGVRRERVPVQAQLTDGTPFNVVGVRGPAKNAGDDEPIRNPDSTYDHGELSQQQAQTLQAMQSSPIFPTYETSGADGENCVAGHAEVASRLGMPVAQPHKHALPQELAKSMADMKLDSSPPRPKK